MQTAPSSPQDWTSGYVADIGYTYGYYPELNPQRATLPLLASGVAPPRWETACELGFGQGVSVNIHAAAGGTEWWGTDFNPAQAGFAQELARASGSGARLFDQAFEEFCRRPDLPDFDFIALHGIWSWISDDNRRVIVDFLRRKLKVGGVLYVSYNTLPGWATMLPMRHLMNEHVRAMGAPGEGLPARIGAALDFTDRLLALNPAYERALPQIAERMKGLRQHDRNYLAHEYFNRDWLPMHFADMAQWLQPAKLSYAASAHYLSLVDTANMSGEQAALLREIPDVVFRETVRDHVVNQGFRRDLWMRGVRQLTALETIERLRRLRVMLLTPASEVSMKLKAPTGEISMQEAVYRPLVEALDDGQAREVGEVEARLRPAGLNHAQVLQALLVLASRGDVVLVQDGEVQAAARAACARLNAWLMDRARGAGDVAYLASPVSGGAATVPRFQQLFLLARQHGARSAEDLARRVWADLSALNQRLVKDGKTLESAEENLAHLRRDAAEFTEKQLPMLRRMGVAGE